MIFAKPVEKFDKTNFMYDTACAWRPATQPKRKPDYESDSGSRYWYTENGVIRSSDHWGASIASCKWWLTGKADRQYATRTFGRRVTGCANWNDFVDRSAWDGELNQFVYATWFTNSDDDVN